MNARQLEEFFARIDLDPQCASGMDLPEGWRVTRPSDFTFLQAEPAGSMCPFTFLIDGPWGTLEDIEDGELEGYIGRTEWGLPDHHCTLLVFRPDEDTSTTPTEPPRPTRWPAWDRLCQ